MTSDRAASRRRFLAQVSMAGAGFAPWVLRGQSAPAETVVAKTTSGPVRGSRGNGVCVFKGIPYAGSPAGENRFKAAPKFRPWSGVRDALSYSAQAIQPSDPAWPKEWKPAPSDENCLYLNVWTQGVADGRKRPVMFYSHGGGFATGNGGADVFPQNLMHDGAALAASYDVVVVTHNHRLGLLGYLYLGEVLGEEYAASGCAGMLDITAALEWVRDNIANFGGDPDNVMIWGESGGGAKTATLTALPAARGLFHKASIESGATLRLQDKDAAAEATRSVLSKLGLSASQARELLKIPADRLRDIQPERPNQGRGGLTAISGASMGFSPVVDGRYIPAHPFDPVASPISAQIPMIVGSNKDETIFFFRGTPAVFSMDEAGLRDRLRPTLGENTARVLEVYQKSRPNASPADLYIAITTAQWMGVNTIRLAERKAEQKAAPVYMYQFTYESEVPVSPGVNYTMKAAHAMEIAFKFNHPDNSTGSGKRPERYKAARNMSRAWAVFARNSDPNHSEIPKWPAYTLDRRATMLIDSECKVVNDPNREERLLWEQIG
ncbi:MAG TPA: carboxylesterase family protein [Bryobacteraceae bacterium]|nr:carboxylesterase family protein [Bryobacteraceae bacterium]